ncbi:MAG TPA: T9SS type A sorting domain-containing protein, partial [Flavobacteriales bacterium]|nr:T9SS type A sorting domain-containing protein [Flavobacteriales bacterium]
EELTVWPVPAAEEIYMGIEQPSGERVQVRVLDINGRAVRPWGSPEVTGSDIVVLRIDAVLEGMYTIQVKEGGRIRSACFVKVE